jgi:hypothetical protein
MARNGKAAPAGNGSAQPGEPSAQDAVGVLGIGAARELIGTSLASLTGMVNWLEQMQSLNSSTLSGWSQALALCSRDLERAKDSEQLMALPARMANHQLEQTSRQLVKAMQDLFEAQAKWADQWRMQFADQMQQATGSDGGGANGGLQPSSLAAIGRFQGQWLALTRNWIDAMSAVAPARLESAGR